jgi:DNA-binding NtrC family response regulator
VAATNRDPQQKSEPAFRSDFFHRLSTLRIRLPPLRDRLDDLPLLVAHLSVRAAADLGVRTGACTPGALRLLACHTWPGNVRELLRVLKNAYLQDVDSIIDTDDLLPLLSATADEPPASGEDVQTLADTCGQAERLAIVRALAKYPRLSDAARALGIDLKTLYSKRRHHGLLP